jgi:hypothetical protein
MPCGIIGIDAGMGIGAAIIGCGIIGCGIP